MPVPAGSDRRWDERIARARALSSRHRSAAGPLAFYAALAEYQKALVAASAPLLEVIPTFLEWLPGVAPAALAEAIEDLRRLDRAQWEDLVRRHGNGDEIPAPAGFVIDALSQPFAEEAAIRAGRTDVEASRLSPLCPHCSALPVVGVLREEGHGASRSLVCGSCLSEHKYLRGVCPACGEEQFDLLAVFTADRLEHVRIDACDRCRTYLKTIDLSKDGLAIPIVDDIASVSLDLWARDRGYVRLRSNLLRL